MEEQVQLIFFFFFPELHVLPWSMLFSKAKPSYEVVELLSLIKQQFLFTLGASSPLLWKWKKRQMKTNILTESKYVNLKL